MRIIAGELRGRMVGLPKGSRIRPATGYVLELVMNLFTPDRLAQGVFLDLCAGSGLVGFEALSRGAPACIFVEADRATAHALGETADRFGVAARCHILNRDARRCLAKVSEALVSHSQGGWPEKVSCVFMDPPFIKGMAHDLLDRFGRSLLSIEGETLLADDSLIIIRTPDKLPAEIEGLEFISERLAGSARVWLYRRGERHGAD